MATLTSQIEALITFANETTGKGDTRLGDAVKSLADGYGGGESADDFLFKCLSKKLEEIVIPEGIKTIAGTETMFHNNKQLKKVTLPNSLTDFKFEWFKRSSDSSIIDIIGSFENVTSISGNECDLYFSINGTKKLTLPNIVTIGGGSFSRINYITTVDCGESITELRASAFNYGPKTFIIRAKTPPVFGGRFTYLTAIYVPDDVVDAYKSSDGWSYYQDRIYPLSSYVE